MRVNENKPVDAGKLKEVLDKAKAAREKAVDKHVDKAMWHLDRDKNGQLGADEATKLRGFDANHDGKVDAGEAQAGIQKFDQNGDGGLDREEFKAGRKAIGKLWMEDQFIRSFARRDADQDKVLSGGELGRQTRKFDGDCDGKVTFEEYQAGSEADSKARAKDRFNASIEAALKKKAGS